MFYVIWYFSRFSRVYYLPRLEIFHEVWGRCLFTTNLVSKMFTCQMSLNTFYVRFFVIMTCKWTAMVYILYFCYSVSNLYSNTNKILKFLLLHGFYYYFYTLQSMRIKGHLFSWLTNWNITWGIKIFLAFKSCRSEYYQSTSISNLSNSYEESTLLFLFLYIF